jgi:hypothetical protein
VSILWSLVGLGLCTLPFGLALLLRRLASCHDPLRLCIGIRSITSERLVRYGVTGFQRVLIIVGNALAVVRMNCHRVRCDVIDGQIGVLGQAFEHPFASVLLRFDMLVVSKLSADGMASKVTTHEQSVRGLYEISRVTCGKHGLTFRMVVALVCLGFWCGVVKL